MTNAPDGTILSAAGIQKRFGALVVLDDIDFAMGADEAVGIVGPNGAGLGRDEAYEEALGSLKLCGMLGVANRRAETLGLLDRKRLELARALAARPTLLLLDEIGGGLTDGEAGELVETIRELRHRKISIVWIEHIVHILLQVAERLICMDAGKIIADGEPQAVMADPQVISAYLGGGPK